MCVAKEKPKGAKGTELNAPFMLKKFITGLRLA
jgi:hypothetical protein